jgi:hypothetical protein
MRKTSWETEPASAQNEIVIERRERIGTIQVSKDGTGSAIAHAFTMAGDYLAGETLALDGSGIQREIVIEFSAFGHTFRATMDEDTER